MILRLQRMAQSQWAALQYGTGFYIALDCGFLGKILEIIFKAPHELYNGILFVSKFVEMMPGG